MILKWYHLPLVFLSIPLPGGCNDLKLKIPLHNYLISKYAIIYVQNLFGHIQISISRYDNRY